MSDIIQDAKQLLDGATPGPWKFEESTGYEYPAGPEWGPMMTELEHSVQDKDGYHLFGAYNDYRMIEAPGNLPLAAAAPELAQALAEETYEYAVQAKTGSKWEYMQDGFFRDAWFSELRKAKAGARELRSIGKETRIVRRRVSPPEVIDERCCA